MIGVVVEVSVREAAERLGVSPQRVRAMAAAGRIPARKLGRDWAIDLDQVGAHALGPRGHGRPLSARSSWAILAMIAGEQPRGLSRSELARARARLGALARPDPGVLSARAGLARFVVHRGLRDRLAGDRRVVLGGASAASHHGADLISLGEVEAYVRAEDLESLVRDYALVPPSAGARANVVFRIPVPGWPFDGGERVAGPAVVAMDLVDAGDERSVRAGRQLLVRLAQAG
jgi:excisionase family DNA binding protein